MYKGRAHQLTATVSPDDATSTEVTWKSSNTNVATVSAAGKVVAKGKGTATITCTAKDGSGITATCKVTVKIPVSSVKLNRSTASIYKGKKLTLKATVGPSNANNKAVTWKSSNTKVAVVSAKGVITARGKGAATITCTAKDGSGKKATCKVTVKLPVTTKITTGSGSGNVWISATGTKYHSKNNCGTMNPAKAKKMTKQEAERKGYTPCKKCY